MKRRKNNPSSTSARPLVLIIIGLLLMGGAVIWLILNPDQPQAAATQAAPTNDPNLPFPEIQRVTLDDAKAALDSQQAVFVDVRSRESYTVSHIPGAINIPVGELASRAGELNADDWIITYCT